MFFFPELFEWKLTSIRYKNNDRIGAIIIIRDDAILIGDQSHC